MFKSTPAFSSFSVDDIDKARQFYGQTLGIEVADIKGMEDMGMVELHMGNGSRIMMYAKPNHAPATFTILNFMVDTIDEAVEALTKKGVKFEIYDLPDFGIKTDEKGIACGQGPAIAWFKDPAGNILAIMEKA